MQCPRCQQENPREANFCLNCATPLKRARPADPDLNDDVDRLRRALSEALEQQTATSEILRVISNSPTDVRPVFDAIAETAARLCESFDAAIYRPDGDRLVLVAHHGAIPLGPIGDFSIPFVRGTVAGQSMLSGRTVHVADVQTEGDEFPQSSQSARQLGFRTILCVPLKREGVAIGSFSLRRTEVQLFTDRQVALLETFADQAVIAIENVRLFKELETRNHELTETLEQQTATAEILRVISSSPTDVRPVFDAIVTSAVRLCGGVYGAVYRRYGDMVDCVAHYGLDPDAQEFVRRAFPRPVTAGRSRHFQRALVDGAVVSIADIAAEPDVSPRTRDFYLRHGGRCVVLVPLVRQSEVLGVLGVGHRQIGAFSDNQLGLLKTFADQAVIAIENVRLFKETKEALEQQTATSQILRVISSSPTDVQPVFDTIVQTARALCGADSAGVLTYDGEQIQIESLDNANLERADALRQEYPMPANRGHATGRAILTVRPVHIPDVREDPEYALDALRDTVGLRSLLSVPMVRDGIPIGAITLQRWVTPRPFSDPQIELLKTFADQAVIAIENVRLFNETRKALEQQTATSEILRVISSSPTDVQPVFDTIAAAATRLCAAQNAGVFLFDGTLIHFAAHHNWTAKDLDAIGQTFPRPPGPGTVTARAILTRAVAHTADISADPAYEIRGFVDEGFHAILSVPMLRDGEPIGAISVTRREAVPFTDKQIALLQTFADQAVIAVENVRLFTELEARNGDLAESLEQQTATAEVLRVISSSPTDVQPVFDTISERAMRLCGASVSGVLRFDGELVHIVALANVSPDGAAALRSGFPMPPSSRSASARAILMREIVHLPDIFDDPEYGIATLSQPAGFRSILSVPMLREGDAIGGITVGRPEPGRFSDRQIALLKAFADQAVIAIENVRLFTELEARNRDLTEALEQQTATSDILRVISSSPTDVQPVFDTIAERAVRLCDGLLGGVYRFDGTLIHFVAHYNWTPEGLETVQRVYPRVPSRETQVSTAILDGTVVEVRDFDAPGVPPSSVPLARALGYRSILAIPMLRHGNPIGAIAVARAETGPFSPKEIELLKTFADQAVIAVENVRLFKELQEKNLALTEAHAHVTEALEQQTATSEILRAISRSQTDVQPVFDAIVHSAARLLRGYGAALTRIAGDQIELAALTSTDDAGDAAVRAIFPQSLQSEWPYPQAIRNRAPLNITDFPSDRRWPEAARDRARVRGSRSWVVVPMLHHDAPVGTISVIRREPGGFTDAEVALLKTFADQAVIAIENVRLFKELEARTQELTRSVGELRALGEVGQAISSTLDLRTVLSTIVARATQLSGTDAGVIYEYDEPREVFVPRATEHLEAEIVETMLATPVRRGEGATGRLAEIQEPIQVPDILAAPAESRVRGALVRAGYRALLAVPLVREGHLLGGLTVIRKATGAFPPEVVDVLKTFATQSALAIQNARLFHEIADKSQQLEAASRHKSEFLANMSHELRTPLNAIIGFSEVLAQGMFGAINDKQTEYLQDILESGRHLLSLINDILDLSKIEAGRMELELSEFDLPQAIQNALTLVRERALRRGIALHHTIDDRIAASRADERKVKQVLLNLLSNAIKFTPEGGRIEVRAAPVDGMVEVSVTDTAVGIAPEDQETVFEEFRQVGATDKKAEGTGLGLALSRKFIELHGGKIWVNSELGSGSTFTFTLPVRT